MSKNPSEKSFRRSLATGGVSAFLLLAVTILIWQGTTEQKYKPDYKRTFYAFGTSVRLSFWNQKDAVEQVSDKIQNKLTDFSKTINLFEEGSAISELNGTASRKPYKCGETLWQLLERSEEAHKQTSGAFDVTIRPLMATWGFYGKEPVDQPSAEQRKNTLKRVGFEKLELDAQAREIEFKREGMGLDFGGIAKGYALKSAKEMCQDVGVDQALANIGGNVYAFSKPPPDKEAYTIGIQDPFSEGDIFGKLRVLDRAVATSGDYENVRRVGDEVVTHIMDPRTGKFVKGTASVTVVSRNCVDSDVFSTAIFVEGETLARKFVREHPDAAVVMVVREDGKIRIKTFGDLEQYDLKILKDAEALSSS